MQQRRVVTNTPGSTPSGLKRNKLTTKKSMITASGTADWGVTKQWCPKYDNARGGVRTGRVRRHPTCTARSHYS